MNTGFALIAMAFISANIDAGQVLQGLRDSETAVSSYSFHWTIGCKEINPVNRQENKATIKGKYTIDVTTRRFCLESEESWTKEKKEHNKVSVETYDGNAYVSLIGTDSVFHNARISSFQESPTWRIPPEDFLYHFKGNTIHALLKENSIGSFEVKDINRSKFAFITSKAVPFATGMARYSFQIDLNKGFAVVKRSLQSSTNPPTDWFDYATMHNEGYKEVSKGIWLPSQSICETYKPFPVKGEYLLRNQYIIVFSDWSVNNAVTNSQFTISIPKNVVVDDRIRKSTYVVNNMSDLDLDHQIRIALGKKPSRLSSLHVLLAILVANAVFIFLILSIRHRRRRTA